jgi:hypothetical protein
MSKSKKVKARKAIADSGQLLYVGFCTRQGDKFHVLPADAGCYDRMVEQMWFAQGMLSHEEVRKQLAAIGITRPTTKSPAANEGRARG